VEEIKKSRNLPPDSEKVSSFAEQGGVIGNGISAKPTLLSKRIKIGANTFIWKDNKAFFIPF